MHLRVRANDELLLDAGTVETAGSSELVIHPPQVTLFHQVLDYLRAKPDPPAPPRSTAESEGVVAAAVVLRWGSYFAVLADGTKPVWSAARSLGTSRISDSEMARINIEASAALAGWIDICREDRDQYEKLVRRALAYLPIPKLRPCLAGWGFAMLAMPDVAANMVEVANSKRVARLRADAEAHPSRLFANALVNTAWRNGPVEDIHAGNIGGFPLDRRRVTAGEERTLLDFAVDRLTTGMEVVQKLALERSGRSWAEKVLPYGLAGMMRITPTGWTLTEETREVRLPRE